MFFEGSDLYKVVPFQKYHIGSTFTSVGIPTSPIVFQIPAVETPDPATEGDWVQMTSDMNSWQLDSNNLALTVAGTQATVRIVRANTSDNCRWKW